VALLQRALRARVATVCKMARPTVVATPAEVTVSATTDCTELGTNWRLHWNSTVLSSLLNDPSTHDVTFKTSDGGSVSAHKAIVAASSPVFYDMLYRNSKSLGEGSSRNHRLIPYELTTKVDSVTFSKLITFIYTGKVTVNSTLDSTCLNKMLNAACYFKVGSLETILIKFAKSSLNVNNIVAVASNRQNCNQLQKCCQKFICDNINEVICHSTFVKLPAEVILEVCKSSDLNISEIDLFMAIVRWNSHQSVHTTAASVKIFQEIRYPLILSDDLMNKVKPTKLADPNLYTGALEYHLNPAGYNGPPSQLVRRKYKSVVELSSSANDESMSSIGTICLILLYVVLLLKQSTQVIEMCWLFNV